MKVSNKRKTKEVIEKYTSFVNDKFNLTTEEEYKGKIPFSYYKKIEQSRIKKDYIKKIPFFDSNNIVVMHANYTSPAGNVCDDRKKGYSFFELENILEKVKEIDKKKRKIAIERAKVTSSLRYDVLKRDNYKCVICGRSSYDGVKLHVDHIKPVSKGGKTEINNLQTLCEDCNLGKGAKYDYETFNI